MAQFKKLSPSELEGAPSSNSTLRVRVAWVGSTSVGRARGYDNLRSMLNPSRTGQTIKALCQGSMPQPYRVEVTFGAQGISDSRCSCPVGGRCKHVAALLLVWLRQPEAFTEVQSLDSTLAQRSQAELIALIRQMVARHPDLEVLLELPMPGGTSPKLVDPENIRRQVTRAFHGAGDEWGSSYALAGELEQIVRLGNEYATAQAWQNAATVYRVVAEEILDKYEMIYDDEGETLVPVNACVEGLNLCLDHIKEPIAREGILRALFDIAAWDIDYGGIGVGDEAPEVIAAHVTDEERERVIAWVQEALAKTRGRAHSDWAEKAYGGFLLDLQIATLDDESFLRICRETGRTEDVVERLLALGRIEEAAAETRGGEGHALLHLATRFVAHGQGDLAEQLVRERLQQRPDSAMMTWLKERAKARGDLASALLLAEQLFWLQPNMQVYEEIKVLAQQQGQWATMRPELFAKLAEKNHCMLLTDLHLVEQEVDKALETLELVKGSRYRGWGNTELSIRVARAAEAHRPHKAIQLYLDEVKPLIKAQGRPNYATAASYLVRVREVYKNHLKDPTGWDTLINQLREQHRNLPALKDELKKAGL